MSEDKDFELLIEVTDAYSELKEFTFLLQKSIGQLRKRITEIEKFLDPTKKS